MVDFRTNKSVRERVNLGFHRKPNPLLRKRRWLTWSVLVASLAAVAFLIAWDDKRAFWAGELSSSHKLFQNDCQQCHVHQFQPAVRFATFDHSLHSVSVEACRNCHRDIHNLDHNRYIADHDIQFIDNCVVCHVEHQGDVSLSRISDAHCVNCHGGLHVKGDARSNFHPQITSLADHPDFAFHRTASGGSVGAEHLVNGVAKRDSEGVWADRAQIKFNHHYHLEPQGLPVPPGHPEYANDGTFRKKLTCASCHQPDDTGRYLKPINYEKHCAECHRLEYRTELSLVGNDKSLPLPHESPTLIRSLLRDRLMAYANAFPERLQLPSDRADQPAASEPRHPNKNRAATPSAEDKWTWVEDKMSRMEAAIAVRTSGDRKPAEQVDALVMPTDDIIGHIQTGCAHCHVLERPTSAVGSNNPSVPAWGIVPPKIPDRWLRHSRFDHSKHTNVADIFHGPAVRHEDEALPTNDRSCLVCHDSRISSAPGIKPSGTPGGLRLSSKNTADILIPSIRVCQTCHTKSAAVGELKGSHARSNCVECHRYHHPGDGHPQVPELPDGVDGK